MIPQTRDDHGGAYIALGLDGALKLATFMEHCPAVEVKHLLLSDMTTEEMDSHQYEDESLPLIILGDEYADEYDDGEEIGTHEVKPLTKRLEQYGEATTRILDLAAPSLHTLSYLTYLPEQSPGKHKTTLLSRHYPKLVTLTTNGAKKLEELSASMPHLTHLHIVTGGWLEGSFPALSTFVSHLPALTHIRFTGARDVYYGLPWELGPGSWATPGFWAWLKSKLFALSRHVPLVSPQPKHTRNLLHSVSARYQRVW